MVEEIILWIIDRIPEIIATITGLLYIIYSIERNILLWPYGIISSAIYVYIFYTAGIYADTGVYVYYVLIGFYGWYHWIYGKFDSKTGKLTVSKIDLKSGILLTLVTAILFLIISFILRKYTNSQVPFLDAFITSLSVTATWLLTRKILENWILWIIVDGVSVGLYLYKELYPSVLLFLVYTILSIVGYYDWLKEWKQLNKKD